MKKIIFIFTVLFFAACKKDPIQVTDLENSLRAWESYKASINNSYTYIRYYGSVFGGHTETKITVSNGKVTSRAYVYGNYAQNSNVLVEEKSWTEDATNLNTHNEGSPSITLDEIYADAKANYLSVSNKENMIYFEKDDRGLMTLCGYVPKGCMDDCFNGYRIKSITSLK